MKEIMTLQCPTPGCMNSAAPDASPCDACITDVFKRKMSQTSTDVPVRRTEDIPMSEKYPKYYKKLPKDWDSIDVYGVHHIFRIDDPSGMLQHASKKLLLSGVRTGGKSQRDDIREARDTLNRWLQLNP